MVVLEVEETEEKIANHGFETASEGELSNHDDEGSAHEDQLQPQQEEDHHHREQVEEQGASPTSVSPQVASNDDVNEMKQGKYEDTIKECSKALELKPVYVKALVRRGEAHEKLEHFEEAIADMKKILEIDSSNDQARRVICHLEPLAAEKLEKMKEEMIAQLKDMRNSLLGRFGMSVDNFQAVKDPNTGSYSISFQR